MIAHRVKLLVGPADTGAVEAGAIEGRRVCCRLNEPIRSQCADCARNTPEARQRVRRGSCVAADRRFGLCSKPRPSVTLPLRGAVTRRHHAGSGEARQKSPGRETPGVSGVPGVEVVSADLVVSDICGMSTLRALARPLVPVRISNEMNAQPTVACGGPASQQTRHRNIATPYVGAFWLLS